MTISLSNETAHISFWLIQYCCFDLVQSWPRFNWFEIRVNFTDFVNVQRLVCLPINTVKHTLFTWFFISFSIYLVSCCHLTLQIFFWQMYAICKVYCIGIKKKVYVYQKRKKKESMQFSFIMKISKVKLKHVSGSSEISKIKE